MDWDWFEVEDSEVSPGQKTIVDIVRESARSWRDCRSGDTVVLVFPWDEDEGDQPRRTDEYERYDIAIEEATARRESVLKLIVNLVDPRRNLILATLGATVAGDWLFCSQRHDQSCLPEPSTSIAHREASGPPEELGRIAAAWFDEIVHRPMVALDHPRAAAEFIAAGAPLPEDHVWVRNGPVPVHRKKPAPMNAGGRPGDDDALSWIDAAVARQVDLSVAHTLRAGTEARDPASPARVAPRPSFIFDRRQIARYRCPTGCGWVHDEYPDADADFAHLPDPAEDARAETAMAAHYAEAHPDVQPNNSRPRRVR